MLEITSHPTLEVRSIKTEQTTCVDQSGRISRIPKDAKMARGGQPLGAKFTVTTLPFTSLGQHVWCVIALYGAVVSSRKLPPRKAHESVQ